MRGEEDLRMDYKVATRKAKRSTPNTLIQLEEQFCDPSEIRGVYEYIVKENFWAPPSTFFFDLHAIRDSREKVIASLERYFGPVVSRWAIGYMERLSKRMPSFLADGGRWMEFWVRTHRQPMGAVLMHLDTFDFSYAGVPDPDNQPLPFPSWGSLYIMGPEAGITGGSTFVASEGPGEKSIFPEHMYEWRPLELIKSLPGISFVEVPPKENRLTIFRGDLPHFMGPIEAIDPEHPRVAVAVGGWDDTLPSEHLRLEDGVSSWFTPEQFSIFRKLQMPDVITLSRIVKRIDLADLAKIRKFIPDWNGS
jgi:hypothetical protein